MAEPCPTSNLLQPTTCDNQTKHLTPMSWSTIKTNAIILKVVPFREADRLYSAFTPEFGKVTFVGRGAQKGRAKLAPHLEPFAIVNMEVVQGKRSTTVIGVERLRSFGSINTNIEKRILAQQSLGLMDIHTHDLMSDEAMYRELESWLTFIDGAPDMSPLRSLFALSTFLCRMMAHLGYAPALSYCVSCKKNILPLSFRWHGGKGGLVCSDCQVRDPEEWFAARLVREEAITLLRLASTMPYEDVFRLALDEQMVLHIAQMLHDSMVYHLPFEPRAPFWEGIGPLEFNARVE